MTQTSRRTHGHGYSMSNSAQWGRVGEKSETPYFTCHMSCFTCHISLITCQLKFLTLLLENNESFPKQTCISFNASGHPNHPPFYPCPNRNYFFSGMASLIEYPRVYNSCVFPEATVHRRLTLYGHTNNDLSLHVSLLVKAYVACYVRA